jgi:hypothetical protein
VGEPACLARMENRGQVHAARQGCHSDRSIRAAERFVGTVDCHPVRNRIDDQADLLRSVCHANHHFARWDQASDEVDFRCVQVERFTVEIHIHLRVGEKDLRRATLGHNVQHRGFLQLLDGLSRQDHRRLMLAPGLLRLDNVVADDLIAHEQPRLVYEEGFERGQTPRIAYDLRCPVEYVKQEWLQQLRYIAPASEVERLEIAERQRVGGIIEEKAVLPCACPAIKPILQFAKDAREIRERPLAGLQHVNTLDGVPQADLFLEVEPIPLPIAFDQHAHEAEQELLVLAGGLKRERVDREIALLPADVQIAATEDVRQGLEAAADIEDKSEGRILLGILQQEVAEIRLPASCHAQD